MTRNHQYNWQDVLVKKNLTVLSAIKCMDTIGMRAVLVIDDDQHLLGIITDGDIRRYMLKHGSLEATVEAIMSKNPTTASLSETKEQLLMKMQSAGILHLPIIDSSNRVAGLETFDSLLARNNKENWVVFMAGGVGKRLHPLTIDCPKPLLKVGDKPIAEILLENFIKCGFKNFYFSVNYKSDMIRDYFGTGDKWGVEIKYIEENAALGTAGSLSLLPAINDKPFFVINADILTNINFSHVLDYHENNQSYATLCVRQHQSTIPFGLVKIDEKNHALLDIEEKPTKNFFINAGIYIFNPKSLEYLSYNSYCDMPNFLINLVNNHLHVSTFPIREYWIDIGHHDNLVRASNDYLEVFA